MTKEELQTIIRQVVREELESLYGRDRYTFQKNIQIFDGRNIQVGRGTGTKLGTATDQKIGFLGKSPVSQQSAISDPAGGGTIDTQARAAISSLIDALQAFGFIA